MTFGQILLYFFAIVLIVLTIYFFKQRSKRLSGTALFGAIILIIISGLGPTTIRTFELSRNKGLRFTRY
ncbi:MAG: hypothetical protein QQN41_14135, partial [Nitrosopumilus sp.]